MVFLYGKNIKSSLNIINSYNKLFNGYRIEEHFIIEKNKKFNYLLK